MPHVFVETNWLFAYAAPAHHQVPVAARLLDRARDGEFTLHLPNVCIGEGRQAIRTKCQPRTEARALRRFIVHAVESGSITELDAGVARTILDQYESRLRSDLEKLDETLLGLAELPYLDIFGLDETMLARATRMSLEDIVQTPFDQAILAGILVSAERLWDAGEREICFCETDSDLLPWGKSGEIKPGLRALYDKAHIWVYGDFALTQPARPESFE